MSFRVIYGGRLSIDLEEISSAKPWMLNEEGDRDLILLTLPPVDELIVVMISVIVSLLKGDWNGSDIFIIYRNLDSCG